MQLMVFSVYDSKAKAFMLPFYAPNEAVAVRNFSGAVNDPESQLFRWSTDFTLFHIASWSDDTGEFVLLGQHVNLGLASNFKRSISDDSPKSVSNESHIFAGSKGGNSEKFV